MVKLAIVSLLMVSIQGLKLTDRINAKYAYESDKAQGNSPEIMEARQKAIRENSQPPVIITQGGKNVVQKYVWYFIPR